MAEARTTSSDKPKSTGTKRRAPGTSRPRRKTKAKVVEEHLRSYFDALARRDPKAAAEHWSEEGIEDIVPLGVIRGRDEIEGFLRQMLAAVPDAETTVHRVVPGDRRAAVEWRLAGTFDGAAFQGIEPTGKRVELRGLDLFEVEEGKIVSNTAYYDGADFARQVGMLPPRDSGAERAMKSAFNAVTKVRAAVSQRAGS